MDRKGGICGYMQYDFHNLNFYTVEYTIFTYKDNPQNIWEIQYNEFKQYFKQKRVICKLEQLSIVKETIYGYILLCASAYIDIEELFRKSPFDRDITDIFDNKRLYTLNKHNKIIPISLTTITANATYSELNFIAMLENVINEYNLQFNKNTKYIFI